MFLRRLLLVTVVVGAWWLVEGVLGSPAAQAHNCVERYGPDAYSYGEAPGANNGHGHFCGIRQSPTTAPPTTAAPTTAPSTAAPPIDRTGQHSSPHSYWHHDHSDRSHCPDGNHYYHERYSEAQAYGTTPPAGQHRSPHSYVHDDHPDRSHCPDGNHYYHERYSEAQACGTTPPAGQHRSPHSYVHDDHPDRSHCPDGNHYYHDQYTYAQSCNAEEEESGSAVSDVSLTNPVPIVLTSEGTQDVGDCSFGASIAGTILDTSTNVVTGNITYKATCPNVRAATHRGSSMCLHDVRFASETSGRESSSDPERFPSRHCRRFFDDLCYDADDPSQQYFRPKDPDVTEEMEIYESDFRCGTADEVSNIKTQSAIQPSTATVTVSFTVPFAIDLDDESVLRRDLWIRAYDADSPTHFYGDPSQYPEVCIKISVAGTGHPQDTSDPCRDTSTSTATQQPPGTSRTHPTTSAPAKVTGLGAGASGGAMWLGWRDLSGSTPTISYRVLRTGPDGVEQLIATVSGNAYVDRSGVSGTQYTYRVQAVTGTTAGPASEPTNARFP